MQAVSKTCPYETPPGWSYIATEYKVLFHLYTTSGDENSHLSAAEKQ